MMILEVNEMYQLLFRKMGTQEWVEGPMFRDEVLTEDAMALLLDRHTRQGFEAKIEKLSTSGGESG